DPIGLDGPFLLGAPPRDSAGAFTGVDFDVGDFVRLADIGAPLGAGIEQNLIEFGPGHLVRMVEDPGRSPGGGKREGPWRAVAAPEERGGPLDGKLRYFDLVEDT